MPRRVVLGSGLLHLDPPIIEAVRRGLVVAPEKHGRTDVDVVAGSTP